MKFTTSFTTLLSVLTASTVLAAPVQESRRDIWSPHILYPHEGTVWQLGARHNVTWDTSDAPANISNAALIFLRKGNTTFSNNTLASGFDLRAGRTEITVPSDFAPGTDYRVVLFGDSGNWSPQFTITQ